MLYSRKEAQERVESLNKRINEKEKELSILTEKRKKDPDNIELVKEINKLNEYIEFYKYDKETMYKYLHPNLHIATKKIPYMMKKIIGFKSSGGRKTKKKTNKKKTNKKKTNKKKTNKKKTNKKKTNKKKTNKKKK